ncbi:hypothetical protein PMAYCL1PPCAC_17129, partial [Pristionchus mayeri]
LVIFVGPRKKSAEDESPQSRQRCPINFLVHIGMFMNRINCAMRGERGSSFSRAAILTPPSGNKVAYTPRAVSCPMSPSENGTRSWP